MDSVDLLVAVVVSEEVVVGSEEVPPDFNYFLVLYLLEKKNRIKSCIPDSLFPEQYV